MSSNEPVGVFQFGGNTIEADQTGKFKIQFVNGGKWLFDLGEIGQLDAILAEFEQIPKGIHEKVFWRTNGTRIIQVRMEDATYIHLVEGGTRRAYFYRTEIPQLRGNIRLLTSEGAPYDRSIRLVNVVEEGRQEQIVTTQQLPLDNRGSKSPLVVEREFTQEAVKSVSTDTSLGVGFDYYVYLHLETRFGIKQEHKLSERVMVRIEAQPGECKIATITWKEVWVTGYAEFEVGNQRKKVPFRLKSGLEADIKQTIVP